LTITHHLDDLDSTDNEKASRAVLGWLSLRNVKQLGPAIFIDMAKFANQGLNIGPMSESDLAFQLFYSYLLPQFEGMTDEKGRELWRLCRKRVGVTNEHLLRTTLISVLGITIPDKSVVEGDGGEDDNETDLS